MWVSDDVVVVVMVAVALIVAMVNPFLDFETSGSGDSGSGDGVCNNNNNGDFGQERKKAGTPSRVIVGSPVTSEAQAIPRHGEATIVTQHERCFPGSSLRVVKEDREDGQDGLLQAYSCVRMNLKPGTGRGYRQKQDGWTSSHHFSGTGLVPSIVIDKGIPSSIKAWCSSAAPVGTSATTKHLLPFGKVRETAVIRELEPWFAH